MTQFRSILVATDTRLDDHPIVSEAAGIARRCQSALKIVDVVPEFPWIVRLALKEHDEILETLMAQKRERIEALAAPLRSSGLQVETAVLSGRTSVEIIREVLRGGHDLVFRVAKGKTSQRSGFFGTTSLHLLRDCPCAVWLAAAGPSPHYSHVMACIDTTGEGDIDAELNAKVYDAASFVSLEHLAKLSIVQAWTIFGEGFLFTRTRMEDFQHLTDNVRRRIHTLLDQFLQPRGSSSGAKNVYLLKGEATAVLPAFAVERAVDLIVMGTVARSGAAGLIIGNTAERILDQIECSVLALKPDDFASPIRLPNAG